MLLTRRPFEWLALALALSAILSAQDYSAPSGGHLPPGNGATYTGQGTVASTTITTTTGSGESSATTARPTPAGRPIGGSPSAAPVAGVGVPKDALPRESERRVRKIGRLSSSQLSRWQWWWRGRAEEFLRPLANVVEETGEKGAERIDGPPIRRRLDAAALPFLRAGLVDPDESVRAAAVAAIGRAQKDGAMQIILPSLRDSSRLVREETVGALGKIGDAASRSILCEIAAKTAGALAFVETNHTDTGLRSKALIALGLSIEFERDDATLELLRRLAFTADKNNDVNVAAVTAIGLSRSPEFLFDLVRVADESSSDELRSAALVALGRIEDRAALDAVKRGLNARSVVVRRAAAIAAETIVDAVDKSIVDRLIVLTDDFDAPTRRFASSALADVEDPRMIPLFEKKLSAVDPEDASFAALALGRIARRSNAAVRSEIGGKLLDLFLTTNEIRRRGALALACAIADERKAVDPLREVLRTKASPQFIAECAQALGILGAAAAAEDLFNLAMSTDQAPLRASVAESLAMVGGAEAKKFVLRLFSERRDFVLSSDVMERLPGSLTSDIIVDLGNVLRGPKSGAATIRADAARALGVMAAKDPLSDASRLIAGENYPSLQGTMADIILRRD
jgi:HEAT repeat protein